MSDDKPTGMTEREALKALVEVLDYKNKAGSGFERALSDAREVLARTEPQKHWAVSAWDEWIDNQPSLQPRQSTCYLAGVKAALLKAAEMARMHSQYPATEPYDHGYAAARHDAAEKLEREAAQVPERL